MRRVEMMLGVVVLFLAAGLFGCVKTNSSNEELSAQLSSRLPERLYARGAQGWINADLMTRERLQGKVVVLDCWAYWCGPCARMAPDLTASHKKFENRDVQFLGLTSDTEDKMSEITEFLERFGHDWPVAYGASPIMSELGVKALPTVMVFDRQGQAVWNSFESGTLDEAIEKALAN